MSLRIETFRAKSCRKPFAQLHGRPGHVCRCRQPDLSGPDFLGEPRDESVILRVEFDGLLAQGETNYALAPLRPAPVHRPGPGKFGKHPGPGQAQEFLAVVLVSSRALE